jgi:hypothetical protein
MQRSSPVDLGCESNIHNQSSKPSGGYEQQLRNRRDFFRSDEVERGEWALAQLASLTASLALQAEALKAHDLAFALYARLMLGGKVSDQSSDAVA